MSGDWQEVQWVIVGPQLQWTQAVRIIQIPEDQMDIRVIQAQANYVGGINLRLRN